MEANGIPGSILISEDSMKILRDYFDEFEFKFHKLVVINN